MNLGETKRRWRPREELDELHSNSWGEKAFRSSAIIATMNKLEAQSCAREEIAKFDTPALMCDAHERDPRDGWRKGGRTVQNVWERSGNSLEWT